MKHLEPQPTTYNLQPVRGYIAIVTALIFMLITLGVSLTIGTVTFFSRLNKVDAANKESSYFAARSCLDRARLRLSQDFSTYAGNETLNIADYNCSILAVETSGSNKIVKATSTVFEASTNLKQTLDSSLNQVSLEELV